MKRIILHIACGAAIVGGLCLMVSGMLNIAAKCEKHVALCKD